MEAEQSWLEAPDDKGKRHHHESFEVREDQRSLYDTRERPICLDAQAVRLAFA